MVQRADEGWHGDALDILNMGYKDNDWASDRRRRVLQPPSPEALLRSSSRTLSGSLEVCSSDFRILRIMICRTGLRGLRGLI